MKLFKATLVAAALTLAKFTSSSASEIFPTAFAKIYGTVDIFFSLLNIYTLIHCTTESPLLTQFTDWSSLLTQPTACGSGITGGFPRIF